MSQIFLDSPVGIAFGDRVAFVIHFFTFGQSQFDLDFIVFKIKGKWHQSVTLSLL